MDKMDYYIVWGDNNHFYGYFKTLKAARKLAEKVMEKPWNQEAYADPESGNMPWMPGCVHISRVSEETSVFHAPVSKKSV